AALLRTAGAAALLRTTAASALLRTAGATILGLLRLRLLRLIRLRLLISPLRLVLAQLVFQVAHLLLQIAHLVLQTGELVLERLGVVGILSLALVTDTINALGAALLAVVVVMTVMVAHLPALGRFTRGLGRDRGGVLRIFRCAGGLARLGLTARRVRALWLGRGTRVVRLGRTATRARCVGRRRAAAAARLSYRTHWCCSALVCHGEAPFSLFFSVSLGERRASLAART
ncbi:MAG: hypothetical protein EB084_23080, partial [Proteobacteria bacterium]|nr:hypothetical protein [Pseudomonadota bacterium]